MHLQEIQWEAVSWIFQAQDNSKWQAVVNKVVNIRAAQNAENFVTS
jgi:hypothetical protein